MNDPTKQHGAFSWNELMTSDVAGAKYFYGDLLGWQFEDVNMNMPYTILKVGDQDAGGLMAMPPETAGMPPMWGSYVTVDDVDTLSKKVESLGGKVLHPLTDIPTVGRFCVIMDPQGAALTLITYSDEKCKKS